MMVGLFAHRLNVFIHFHFDSSFVFGIGGLMACFFFAKLGIYFFVIHCFHIIKYVCYYFQAPFLFDVLNLIAF